ncbi:MAG TPA: hypothetical protein VHZ73_11820 [Vicinamibacterales bacterium]|nr:hypothetical protein [Vicinamibacterales bacterium]
MTAAVAIACAAMGLPTLAQSAAKHPDLSGSWSFNSSQSDLPRDPSGRGDDNGQAGTDPTNPGGNGGGSGGGYGGRGRGGFGGGGAGGLGGGGFGRGGAGGGGFGRGSASQGNTDDRVRTLELTDEVRHPSATLTVTAKADTVTVVDANNHTRLFHTTGKKDAQQLEAVKVDTKTTWNGDRLVTEYDLGNDRKLRYTYSLADNPRQLLVDVTLQNGKNAATARDAIKYVYDAAPSPPQ